MKTKKVYVYLAATLSMLFWGLSFVWFKMVVVFYEPITIIFLRLVISTFILYLSIRLLGKMQKILPGDRKWFLLLALTQPFCYFLGESFGLKYVSSTVGAVIISTIPVFSPLVAWFIIKEKFSFMNIAGIVVSFIGIVLMLITPDISMQATLKGVLLLFFAVISALAYSVVIRKLPHRYSAYCIITVQNFLGALLFLPLFLIFDFNKFLTIRPDAQAVTALIMLAVFASSLAYMLYIIALKEIGIVRANIFSNLIPVFTAIFSYFLLSEFFNMNKILGVIIVTLGVFLSYGGKIRTLLRNNGKRGGGMR